MNTATLLSELGRRGISIRPEGDQLRYRAPRGALSPDLLAQIRECKAELLAELDQEARAIPVLEISLHSKLSGAVHCLVYGIISRPGLSLPATPAGSRC